MLESNSIQGMAFLSLTKILKKKLSIIMYLKGLQHEGKKQKYCIDFAYQMP